MLQITDLHLRLRSGATLLGVDTAHSLHAVLAQALRDAEPDAIVVTGDIAHDPHPETYSRFADIMAAHYSGPLLCLAGNHDVASPMGELLEREQLDLGNWRLLAMDSHVDDTPAAEVSTREWNRVRRAVEQSADRWLLIATHHPPIDVGAPWLDGHRIKNGDEMLEWLSEHPSVKGMVFGHAHQVIQAGNRDLPLMGTPSTCFQFAPHSERFSIDDRMPGYRWLTLSPDGTLASEVRRVQDYPLQIDLNDR